MATRDNRSSVQPSGGRPSSHFEPTMLTGLEMTEKEIGEGAYGKVVELRDTRSGKLYAAKKISCLDANFDFRMERQFMKKYEEFAKLCHPNLVEFHGFYKLERLQTIPLLVMERMRENLTSLLERSPNIKIAYKLTILLGVAEGLKYLHSRTPVVVHGRLTSNNILLKNQESELQVKIGDVGISTMMKPVYKRAAAICHDGMRSTADFLPPVTQLSQQKGIPSLDIFSYGRIMLHTMTQEWPNPQQKQPFIMAKIKGESAEIAILIKSCMEEKYEQRPSIVAVRKTVQKLRNQLSSKPDENLDADQPEVSASKKSDLEKEEMPDADEIKMLKQAIMKKDEKLITVMNEKDEEIKRVIANKNKELAEKDRLLKQKDIELKEKEMEIEKLTKHLLSFLPDAHMCTVKEFPNQVFVNKEAFMIVTLKNNHGKLIGNTDNSLNIVIRNQNALQEKIFSCDIREIQNGFYSVSFIIKRMGSYSCSVLVRGTNIHDFPRRITCLPYSEKAVVPGYGPKIKSLQNLSSTCYFNSVLQVLNQTPGFIEGLASMFGTSRHYELNHPSNGDTRHINLSNEMGNLLTTMIHFIKEVNSEEPSCQIIKPKYVLEQLTESSKQRRFGQSTQEDSHELLRYLLYELKKEEVEFIKEHVCGWFGVSTDPRTHDYVSGELKDALKKFLRAASKVNDTPIDKIFGGMKLSIVICRECFEPTHTREPFFDISLGIPDTQDTDIWQYPYQKKSKAPKNTNKSFGRRHENIKNSSTYSMSKEDVQKILKEKGLPCQAKVEKDPNGATDLETSLADHTDVDNMDEDNKFICKKCSEKVVGANREKVKLCLVTKQILIDCLPPTLILHFKRFDIGDYHVTKNNTHISFPHILNVAPYCTTTCLKEFGDANNNILYGLYGVVMHMGSTLQSGHYVAHVRRRPDRQPTYLAENWVYNHAAADDGIWFHTSDLNVTECPQGFRTVEGSEAYMLFYELLPKINILTNQMTNV